MILGGDEIGRTQHGNNNAYCQDDELSLVRLGQRRRGPAGLHQDGARPAARQPGPAAPRVPPRPRRRAGPDGPLPTRRQADAAEDWQDPSARTLAVALDGRQIEDAEGETTSDRFLLLLNAHYEPVEFAIPPGRAKWDAVLTTGARRADAQAHPAPDRCPGRPVAVAAAQPVAPAAATRPGCQGRTRTTSPNSCQR